MQRADLGDVGALHVLALGAEILAQSPQLLRVGGPLVLGADQTGDGAGRPARQMVGPARRVPGVEARDQLGRDPFGAGEQIGVGGEVVEVVAGAVAAEAHQLRVEAA